MYVPKLVGMILSDFFLLLLNKVLALYQVVWWKKLYSQLSPCRHPAIRDTHFITLIKTIAMFDLKWPPLIMSCGYYGITDTFVVAKWQSR